MPTHVPHIGISLRKHWLLVLPFFYNGATRAGIFNPSPPLLPQSVTDEELGHTVCNALASCREKQFDFDDAYLQGSDNLARAYGLKSKRGLYPGMKVVSIDLIDGSLRLRPKRARGGGSFESFPEHWRDKEDVIITHSSSDAEIGAAARLALSRSSA